MVIFGYQACLVILCLVYPESSTSLSDEDKDSINSGLQAGIGITELLENQKFTKSLAKVASSVGPYLGAVAPFVGFILTFLPSEESPEEKLLKEVLKEMKRMMEQIDHHFDKISYRFNEIEKLIKWNVVSVNFGQIEQKILAMAKEFEYLYKVPSSAVKNRIDMFITSYKSDYQNSGTKLYQAIVRRQGVFQEDLGSSVLRFTENNCLQTQQFLLGVMQLLLQASKIELTYLKLKKYNNNVKFMKSDWESKIKQVSDNFKLVDNKCRSRYQKQSKEDAIEFAIHNKHLSNKEFAEKLYKMLSEKYFWREWFVLVYNGISGGRNHYVKWCDGHILHNHGKWKRNFDISSKEMNETTENYCSFRDKNSLITKYNTIATSSRYSILSIRTARDIVKSLPDICNIAIISGYRPLPEISYVHSDKIEMVYMYRWYHIMIWE